jgi:hypothetical protein
MPCYRCGARQVDPDRGESPWKRGVVADSQVLICPGCQSSFDWTAALDRCPVCASAHLVRRLGEIECRDCGFVRPPAGSVGPAVGGRAAADPGQGGDGGLGGAGPGGPGGPGVSGGSGGAGGPGAAVGPGGGSGGSGGAGGAGGSGLGERDKQGGAAPPGLAEEVEQALERVLGRTRRTAGIG